MLQYLQNLLLINPPKEVEIDYITKIISLHYNSILGPTKNSLKYITREFIEYIVNENKGGLICILL